MDHLSQAPGRRMNAKEAQTLAAVANGDDRTLPILFDLCSMRFSRLGPLFRHMIKRGITGKFFYEVAERNSFVTWRIYKALADDMDGAMSRPLNERLDF